MQVNVRILYGIKVAKTLVPLILEYKDRTDENAEAMMKMLKLNIFLLIKIVIKMKWIIIYNQ
jgi:hypothetical protein